MKVGIMSMQRIINYGSFLQAYGLKRILEELDCEVQFVDYHTGQTLMPTNDGTGICRKIKKALEVFKCRAPLREKIRFIQFKKEFADKYYQYLDISSHMNYNTPVDVLVIGSDEVFNCVQDNTNVGYSPELFGVGNRAGRVISYAASFGNTTIKKLETYGVDNEVAGWLRAFDALSVRDNNTGEIVRTLTGIEPEYHLDPVLIYDFFTKEKISDMVDEKNYMVLYGYTGRFSVDECKTIRSFAKERKLKILCIGGVQHCCDRFVDCSPFEVIAYFKNAAAVITDTFHGSILSIITHRKFAVFVRDAGYGNAQKLLDLMKRLKLESQIVSDISCLSDVLKKTPVYVAVDSIIAKERDQSYSYLKCQINLYNKR